VRPRAGDNATAFSFVPSRLLKSDGSRLLGQCSSPLDFIGERSQTAGYVCWPQIIVLDVNSRGNATLLRRLEDRRRFPLKIVAVNFAAGVGS
jgi:hypothetical protein